MPAPTPTKDVRDLICGGDLAAQFDLLLLNAPLRDYDLRERVNENTLPVLGMAYIATTATAAGYNCAVLDAEASGLGIAQTAEIVNRLGPRWVGMNLLAPTFEMSATITAQLDPAINIMLGGHQAKAMPGPILMDPRMRRCEALVIGEAETRVPELLRDLSNRRILPKVMWRDKLLNQPVSGAGDESHMAPDINAMPLVDRTYLVQDPRIVGGRNQANVCGARGCPYQCSFCGAAQKFNKDVTIRVRTADSILAEVHDLRDRYDVTSFRFIDDLFLGVHSVITEMSEAFEREGVGEWAVWDATGRLNVLDRLTDQELDLLHVCGLREVALGVESGSATMLKQIDKRIDPEMTIRVVRRLAERGISVKGYFIFGLVGESRQQMIQTEAMVYRLWELTEDLPGNFTASAFEFRPYPGTPDWQKLMATGRFTAEQLLDYRPIDLTGAGSDELMIERDQFNFGVGVDLSECSKDEIRAALTRVSRDQHARNRAMALAPAA